MSMEIIQSAATELLVNVALAVLALAVTLTVKAGAAITRARPVPLKKHGYFDPATQHHVRHAAYFFGGASRPGGQAGWIDYVPSNFSELPTLIKRGLTPSEVVFSMASPMDEHGYFSLSLGTDYTMAAVRKARAVIIEVNPNVPFAYGNCHIHISQVTALVENDEPVLEVGLPTVCSETCVGRLRYIGIILYDADAVTAAVVPAVTTAADAAPAARVRAAEAPATAVLLPAATTVVAPATAARAPACPPASLRMPRATPQPSRWHPKPPSASTTVTISPSVRSSFKQQC